MDTTNTSTTQDTPSGSHLAPFIMFLKNSILFLTIFYLPIYLKELNFSGLQIGFLLSLFSITAFFSSIPIGMMNDIATPKNLLYIGSSLMAASYLGLYYLKQFIPLILFFTLAGFGNNLMDISLKSYVYKVFASKRDGKMFGTVTFFETLGLSVGFAIGGYVIFISGFKLAFLVSFLLVFPLMLFIRKLENTKSRVYGIKDYKKDMSNSNVKFYCIIVFLFALHWGAETTSYTLFLKEDVGLSQFHIGLFMCIQTVILAITCLIFGYLVDKGKLSFHTLIIIGILFSGIGNIMFFFFTDIIPVFIFRTFHEIGDSALALFIYMGAYALFDKERIGGNIGSVVVVTIISRFIGTFFSGYLGELVSNGFPIFLTGILCLLSLPFVRQLKFKNGTNAHEIQT